MKLLKAILPHSSARSRVGLPTSLPDCRSAHRSGAHLRWGVARNRIGLALLWLLLLVAVGCGGQSSNSDSQAAGDDVQVGGSEIDFTATGISATPTELTQTQLITIDATITNIGTAISGDFVVRAFLKRGTNCDDTSFFIDAQTLSLAGGVSDAFQVSRVIDNVTATGTYYLCLYMDALGDVDESNESNNLIGGTTYPVHVVNCVTVLDCDDSNPCTTDSCENVVGCQYEANSDPCEDGFFCTTNDLCGGGFCQSGFALECADPDLCDGTLYCDEGLGACVNGQPPLPCDDGDLCNGQETCNPADGVCTAGAPGACDALINNAGAPPASSNVVDDDSFDLASQLLLRIRDQGCPLFGEPDSFCPLFGTPTTVEIAAGATVGDVTVLDTSILLVTGGVVETLSSSQDTWVEISGGEVEQGTNDGGAWVDGGTHGYLAMGGQALMSAGFVEDLQLESSFVSPGGEIVGGVVTTLFSGNGSSVRGGKVSVLCALDDPGAIYGSGFNQNAGAFGPLAGASGFVTGILENGETLYATYHQEGSWCYHPVDGVIDTTQTFTLLPPESTFIANGLAASGPDNEIDASDPATQFHDVYVRNENCPDQWPAAYRDASCSSPGAATEVDILAGANITGVLNVLDRATVRLRGGQIAMLQMSAGALVEVYGDAFSIAGTPLPFGDVLDHSGTLVGTLASGEPTAFAFDREDPANPGTYGTINLRSSLDVVAGTSVAGSLFGGIGTIGGVDVSLDVETGGLLSGAHSIVAIEDVALVVPDFNGLAVAARSFQDDYHVWELEFTGELVAGGSSNVAFAYDPGLVSAGQQLILYGWDGSEWIHMTENVMVDTINHIISIDIDGFSVFALIIREYMVPALSLGALYGLASGLAASGLWARSRRATRRLS